MSLELGVVLVLKFHPRAAVAKFDMLHMYILQTKFWYQNGLVSLTPLLPVIDWAIPEIRCTPLKDMGIKKKLSTFFIGNSPQIKHFFGHEGKEDIRILDIKIIEFMKKHWPTSTHWIEIVKNSGSVGELNPGPLDFRSRTLPLRNMGSQRSQG